MLVMGVVVRSFLVLLILGTCCCLQFTLIDIFILPRPVYTPNHRNTRFLR